MSRRRELAKLAARAAELGHGPAEAALEKMGPKILLKLKD
jgi:hypothetical protein